MGPFEALLLDLDGTLVNSRAATEGAWRDWGDAHGLDGERIALSCHGTPSREHVAAWAPHLDADAEAEAIEGAQIASRELTPQFPYAGILLDAMPADRVAIVTSGTVELAQRRLRRAGLPEPAVLVTPKDTERRKPFPDPYLLAAERLGYAPASCLVVEDAPVGIAAARAAGMQVVAVPYTHRRADLADADAVADDLEHVLALVRRHRYVPELIAARERVEAAFAAVPRPADAELCDVDDCDLSVYADWREIEEDLLVGEWGVPFFLAPEALRWYVPAALRTALDHPDEGYAVTDALIRAIDRPPYTEAERAAVVAALEALGMFVDVGDALKQLRA